MAVRRDREFETLDYGQATKGARITRTPNEVQEPREGRRSPRRTPGPGAIDTLRGNARGQVQGEARERNAQEAGACRTGEDNPCGGGNPGEQRAARRDLSARLQRTSGAGNTQKPGEAYADKPHAARANGTWVRSRREALILLREGESFEG
jgi:hypothetical protein